MLSGLRIIAGEWRGRAVATPPGEGTRPTSNRARETLFSMLTSRMGGFTGRRVADLFAGSGALGFEALSRGADHCVFVERDVRTLATVRATADRLGATNRCTFISGDAAIMALPVPAFDLILIDPPYGAVDLDSVISRLIEDDAIAPGGTVCAETDARTTLSPPRGELIADRLVGKARLHLFAAAD